MANNLHWINRRNISIVSPIYNEGGNVEELTQKIKNAILKISYYIFEIIFINDGSTDSTPVELKKIALENPQIKIIQFSRHFGKEIATTAGINHCRGDACIILDSDLQHPPELIPEFIQKWEDGADVVIGIRKNTTGGLLKKVGSKVFYKIMNNISDTKMIPNSTDYRLLDKKVIDAFNDITEKNRMMRGLIDWLGFSRDYIYFQAPKRQVGKPTYSIKKLFNLASSTFVSFSLFPLKIAGYLGILITLFSGFFSFFIFLEKFIFKDALHLSLSGTAFLAMLILFLVGIILSCLGLIALYIAQIHQEVLGRPLYVVKKRINF